MVGVVVDVSHPPFGHENTFAALYTASASLSKGMDVIVVLREDGVFTGLKGQIEPQKNIHLPPTNEILNDVIELDGRVLADKQSLSLRGIESSDLIEGIEIFDTIDIHDILLEFGDHVIAF
jgi:predicted peroxiredoxin